MQKEKDDIPAYARVHAGNVLAEAAGSSSPPKSALEVKEVYRGEIWMADNVITQDECAALIQAAEAINFTEAPLTTYSGYRMNTEVRNNKRIMIEDEKYAAHLFDRLRGAFPALIPAAEAVERARRSNFYPFDRERDWEAVGLNERFRFYRYDPGEYFKRHYDGCFDRSPEEVSHITVLLYLSDGFEGGCTRFWDKRFFPSGQFDAVPKAGSALLFMHEGWLHAGTEVTKGRKYVIRSDVMYRLKSRAAHEGAGANCDIT